MPKTTDNGVHMCGIRNSYMYSYLKYFHRDTTWTRILVVVQFSDLVIDFVECKYIYINGIVIVMELAI